jgi:arylsulfatase A-like enzyme
MQPFLHADGSGKFPPETPYLQNGGTYRSQKNPHAAFAAMITKLDNNVGEVEALIKELGLDGDTYIFFTSDNGPHKEGGADPEYFNSNGPLRGIKRDLYEGGIRVPMLVRAPGKVPAGRVSDQQWAFWDILPTFTDITHSHTLAGIDGVSFKQSLTGGKQIAKHDYFYWQFNEGYLQEAVLKGEWKLIRFKYRGKPEKFELYHLTTDIGEKKDLAATNPDKIKELSALMKKAKSPAENKEFDWSDTEN